MPDDPKPHLDPAKEHERLEELGEEIEHIKRKVELDEHPHEHDPTFIGGEDDENEDDTIAPPG